MIFQCKFVKKNQKKVKKFVYEHGRGISIDYRLNFWNIREEGIVVTIEEAQNIIYDKTLVRCIIWDLVEFFIINFL